MGWFWRRDKGSGPGWEETYEDVDEEDAASEELQDLDLITDVWGEAFEFDSGIDLKESLVWRIREEKVYNYEILIFISTQYRLFCTDNN